MLWFVLVPSDLLFSADDFSARCSLFIIFLFHGDQPFKLFFSACRTTVRFTTGYHTRCSYMQPIMTSRQRNTSRIIDPLWEESVCYRPTNGQYCVVLFLSLLLLCTNFEQTVEGPVKWDAWTLVPQASVVYQTRILSLLYCYHNLCLLMTLQVTVSGHQQTKSGLPMAVYHFAFVCATKQSKTVGFLWDEL